MTEIKVIAIVSVPANLFMYHLAKVNLSTPEAAGLTRDLMRGQLFGYYSSQRHLVLLKVGSGNRDVRLDFFGV